MGRLLPAALMVAAVGLWLLGSSAGQARTSADPQLRCKYGSKVVMKKVHGHKKRVRVCKKKPKPKPPPPQANLELSMRSTLEQVTAGNHVAYSFVVENGGPSFAEDTKLSVELPPGGIEVYGYGGSSQSQACSVNESASANHVECNFGELAPESDENEGLVAYAFLSVQLEPSQAGDYTASAKVVGSTADPSPQDATATKPLHVLPGPPSADLSVSLQSAPTPADVPDGFTETISVTNDGPTEATDVLVTLLLPQGASAIPQIPSSNDIFFSLNGFCPPYFYGLLTTSAVCFDSVGGGETRTAEVRIEPSIHSPATLRTDAVVGSYTRDSNLANNRGSGETAVNPFNALPGVDLRLSFEQPPALTAGKELILPFRLSNLGLAEADEVDVAATITPSIPKLALALATGFTGSVGCESLADGPSSCRLSELASDARATGVLYTSAAPAGSYTATLTVTSQGLGAPVTATTTFEVKPSPARR
jgi:uncharacterized repeat protein (TIGR01451 family)